MLHSAASWEARPRPSSILRWKAAKLLLVMPLQADGRTRRRRSDPGGRHAGGRAGRNGDDHQRRHRHARDCWTARTRRSAGRCWEFVTDGTQPTIGHRTRSVREVLARVWRLRRLPAALADGSPAAGAVPHAPQRPRRHGDGDDGGELVRRRPGGHAGGAGRPAGRRSPGAWCRRGRSSRRRCATSCGGATSPWCVRRRRRAARPASARGWCWSSAGKRFDRPGRWSRPSARTGVAVEQHARRLPDRRHRPPGRRAGEAEHAGRAADPHTAAGAVPGQPASGRPGRAGGRRAGHGRRRGRASAPTCWCSIPARRHCSHRNRWWASSAAAASARVPRSLQKAAAADARQRTMRIGEVIGTVTLNRCAPQRGRGDAGSWSCR